MTHHCQLHQSGGSQYKLELIKKVSNQLILRCAAIEDTQISRISIIMIMIDLIMTSAL